MADNDALEVGVAPTGVDDVPGGGRVVAAGDVSARVVGFAVDSVVLGFATLVVLTVLGVVHGPVLDVQTSGSLADRVDVDRAKFAIDTAAATLLAAAYFAVSWVRRGSTPGQRAVGLQVRPADGEGDVSVRSALIRFVALGSPWWIMAGFVAGNARLICWLLGVIWYVVLAVSVARGSSTTGLHDRLAGTTTVRRVERLP